MVTKASPAPTGKNELATTTAPGALALPGIMGDFLMAEAEKHQPKITMADTIMPRLSVLQALSPTVNKRKPEYVPGAEPGMILNVATLELFTERRLLPVHYIRHHVEWRQNRGGFVADHGEDDSIMARVVSRDDKNFEILDNGNIIQPTPTWYCLDLDNDGAMVVLSMPRTHSRTSRSWMSQVTNEKITHPGTGQKFNPPMFFRSWVLGTFLTSDDKNEWFIWKVLEAGPTIVDTVDGKPDGEPVLPLGTMEKAIRFRDMLVSGAVKADASHFEEAGGGNGGGSRSDDSAPM